MTSRDFCFWLQGFFELGGDMELDATQVAVLKKHLSLVFIHEIDPSMGPKPHQDVLDNIHKPPFVLSSDPSIQPPLIRC